MVNSAVLYTVSSHQLGLVACQLALKLVTMLPAKLLIEVLPKVAKANVSGVSASVSAWISIDAAWVLLNDSLLM